MIKFPSFDYEQDLYMKRGVDKEIRWPGIDLIIYIHERN